VTPHGRTPHEALPDVMARRMRREAGQRYLLMALIALAVIILDQVVKVIVRVTITRGDVIDVLPGIDFVHTINTGIAFSLFSGSTGLIAVLTLVAIGVIGIVLVAYAGQHRLVPIGGGLLLGGSIGNLIDRISRDGVTDFIAIGPWPPFNVADIAVTTGALLLVLALLFSAGDD